MNRRVAPLKKRRQSSQTFKPRFIHFDPQQKLQQKCRICLLPNQLISVCQCNFKYHEKCLLNYIRLQMKKSLITQMMFNASTIKCPASSCKKQIYFVYEEKYRYSCDYFCHKFEENRCNKHLILLLLLLVILSAFLFVVVYLSDNLEQTTSFVLFCSFSLMCLVVAVSMVGVLMVCFSKYFQVRQIFLKSIINYKNRGDDQGGGSSSSSDQNIIYENISQNFQIYVED